MLSEGDPALKPSLAPAHRRPNACNLYPAICNLQPAFCNLPPPYNQAKQLGEGTFLKVW